MHGTRLDVRFSRMSPKGLPATIRHLRPVQPLHFPSEQPEWSLGQSTRHLNLCVLLREILLSVLLPDHSVGCDAFVYFDASNPKRCLAPDAFVKLGVPHESFDSWKTWELRAPDMAVEILSRDTRETITFEEKLKRYLAVGVAELFAVHLDSPPGERLSAWDRVDGDLVERAVTNESTPCLTLGLHFVLAPANGEPVALRLARDASGRDLLPTDREAREAAERERGAAEREREAAEQEVIRLRALLSAKSEKP
jgi:hypothetical protein